MRRLFLFLVFIQLNVIQGQGPRSYLTRSEADTTVEGFQSNVIVEIRTQGDSVVWFGTGRGLSMMRDSVNVISFPNSATVPAGQTGKALPEGGVSAVGVSGNDTLLTAIATTIDNETAGGGLALSVNSNSLIADNVTWYYFDQPKDSSGDSTIIWGGAELRALPVTVLQNNVTYDIAIGDRYYWIASWAGGLRRLNRSDVTKGWKRIPLPDDNQSEFLCGEQVENYQLNPRDPPQGNHNHKVFSVMAYGDTIWAGTANGINRGIIDASGCIDWKHYSFPLQSMSGNWVIGMAKQEWNGRRTIWAVTRAADQAGEESGVSYSHDDGETWNTATLLKGEYGYNIFALDSLVYVGTRNGLWRTVDGQSFANYRPAIDKVRNDQVIDDDVYAVVHDNRDYYKKSFGEALWIGTGDGIARSRLPSSNSDVWRIYRSIQSSNTPYAYPNPFSPTLHNRMKGDGYVRFNYSVKKSSLIRLTILSFAMEAVRTIDYTRGEGHGALKWDGRDDDGNLVANGTYFCNLFYDDASHWVKLVVVK